MTNLFKMPSPPTPTPPPPMPDPQSPAVLEAQRQAATQANAVGRVSTVLTQRSGYGGGSVIGAGAGTAPAYSGKTLGQ